jgi:hypothetical protein
LSVEEGDGVLANRVVDERLKETRVDRSAFGIEVDIDANAPLRVSGNLGVEEAQVAFTPRLGVPAFSAHQEPC